MSIILAVGVGKGGVGKTTASSMLCWAICDMNYKVLAVDFDPQGNLTQISTKKSLYDFEDKTVFEAMKEKNPAPYIFKVHENFDLLPTDDYLAHLSKYLYTEYEGNPYTLLKETLDPIRGNYDFIVIDQPPNLGDHTLNSLSAADYAIPIFQPEPFCYDGLHRYIETIEQVKTINPKLKILGILTSMMDSIASLDEIVYQEAKKDYGDLLFDTVIKRRARVKEYASVGIQNVSTRDKATNRPYIQFAEEVINRVKSC